MRALCAQTHQPIEIIAVDDGSSDGSTKLLRAWQDAEGKRPESRGNSVRILEQGPRGLSAGRNAALEDSKGEWVAITDIDCRPRPTWIEELLKQSARGAGDEQVVAVTGRTVFAAGRTKISELRAAQISRKYGCRQRLATLANGPCSMFNREQLIQSGGFDPDWYHAEDMEVSLRLIANGGSILYSPTAVVEHVAEESLRLFLSKRRRDVRAHMRIIHHHGRGGVCRADGTRIPHDFTRDAKSVVPTLPFWLLLVSLVAYYHPLGGSGLLSTTIWVAASGMLVVVTFGQRLQLLWSLMLWVGAAEGLLDWIFSRNGHGNQP
jgi:cellulose synthase/poly-beta-1,6-N-acetylglucosamine synthase-like glycosyltransferase